MKTKQKFGENCSVCDKFIDFRKDVEGKGWQQEVILELAEAIKARQNLPKELG